MTAFKILNNVVRIAGVVALAIGAFLWGGRLYELLGLHMALGTAAILSLWVMAAIALWRGASSRLATLALLWGAATLAIGASQTGRVVGAAHWIVEVAHLLLGVGAIAIGAILARSASGLPSQLFTQEPRQ